MGLVLAALFFGTLQQGGLAINAHVPREVMDVLQGVVIVAVALGDAARARRSGGDASPGEVACVSNLVVTSSTETVRMAVPYACAALGGVWSEKSGVVNIALEGMLLASALGAVVVELATGSALGWVCSGASSSERAMGAVHAGSGPCADVDAIVSGIALNLVAAGGTRFVLRALYGSSSNSPVRSRLRNPARRRRRGALPDRSFDPLTILTLVTSARHRILPHPDALRASRPGIRRGRSAAASLGIDVPRVRLLAVTFGGAIAGVGGGALALTSTSFSPG